MKFIIVSILLTSFCVTLPAAYSSLHEYNYYNRVILYGMMRAMMNAPMGAIRFEAANQPAMQPRRQRRHRVIQPHKHTQQNNNVQPQRMHNNNKHTQRNYTRINMRMQQPKK